MLFNDKVARDPVFTPSAVQINSHCISDRFLPFYFSCVVGGCVSSPPPNPRPPIKGRWGLWGGVRTPFFLPVEVVYFSWCLLGVGGSLDGVGGCEAVGAPCRRCVRVSVCQSRRVWGVRLALAFGVTSCCSRSLWEPMGGFFPLVLPPVHLPGVDPR